MPSAPITSWQSAQPTLTVLLSAGLSGSTLAVPSEYDRLDSRWPASSATSDEDDVLDMTPDADELLTVIGLCDGDSGDVLVGGAVGVRPFVVPGMPGRVGAVGNVAEDDGDAVMGGKAVMARVVGPPGLPWLEGGARVVAVVVVGSVPTFS